jgi:hypothetical protein
MPSPWVSAVLSPPKSYIVYAGDERAKEGIRRLVRLGYPNIKGYFTDDVKTLPTDFEVYTP